MTLENKQLLKFTLAAFIVIAILLFLFIFFLNKVYASEVAISQPQQNSIWSSQNLDYVAQNFIATSDSIHDVDISVCRQGTLTENVSMAWLEICTGNFSAGICPILLSRNRIGIIKEVWNAVPACGTPALYNFNLQEGAGGDVPLTIGNEYRIYFHALSWQGDKYYKFGYQNTNVYSGGALYLNSTIPTAYDLTFKIYSNGNIASPITNIIDPTEEQNITTNNYTFSGKCKTPGTNRLCLKAGTTIDGCDFNISCAANYTWTANMSIGLGARLATIFDIDALDEIGFNPYNSINADVVSYYGDYYQQSNLFSLSIITPAPYSSNNPNFFYLNATTSYPFVFKYSVPNQTEKNKTSFKLENCNSSYSTCNTIDNNTLLLLDAFNTSLISEHLEASSTAATYYRAKLYQGTTDKAVRRFYIMASSTDTTLPPIPEPEEQTDYGFWGGLIRDLFYPDPDTLTYSKVAISSAFQDAIPFAYWYEFKNQMDELLTTSTAAISFNLEFNVPIQGAGTTTFSLLKSGGNDIQPLLTFASNLRPYISAGIQIWGVLFAVQMAGWILDRSGRKYPGDE